MLQVVVIHSNLLPRPVALSPPNYCEELQQQHSAGRSRARLQHPQAHHRSDSGTAPFPACRPSQQPFQGARDGNCERRSSRTPPPRRGGEGAPCRPGSKVCSRPSASTRFPSPGPWARHCQGRLDFGASFPSSRKTGLANSPEVLLPWFLGQAGQHPCRGEAGHFESSAHLLMSRGAAKVASQLGAETQPQSCGLAPSQASGHLATWHPPRPCEASPHSALPGPLPRARLRSHSDRRAAG